MLNSLRAGRSGEDRRVRERENDTAKSGVAPLAHGVAAPLSQKNRSTIAHDDGAIQH
jgi:hypothetical protein